MTQTTSLSLRLTNFQFHRGEFTVSEVKQYMAKEGLEVRQVEDAVGAAMDT